MAIYIITSNYFTNGFFGSYSTVKRARIAFENFLTSSTNIVSFHDIGNYYYEFTTKNGEIFGAEICWNLVDEEFEEEIVKDD